MPIILPATCKCEGLMSLGSKGNAVEVKPAMQPSAPNILDFSISQHIDSYRVFMIVEVEDYSLGGPTVTRQRHKKVCHATSLDQATNDTDCPVPDGLWGPPIIPICNPSTLKSKILLMTPSAFKLEVHAPSQVSCICAPDRQASSGLCDRKPIVEGLRACPVGF